MIQGEATTKDNSSIIIEGFQSDKLKNSTSPQKLAKEDNNDFNCLDKDISNGDNEEASNLNNLIGKKRNFIENVKQIENFKNDEMQLEKENKKMLKKNIIDIFCDFEIKRPNDINDKKHNKDLKEAIYSKKDFPSTQEEIELKNYSEMDVIEAIKEIYNDEPFKL